MNMNMNMNIEPKCDSRMETMVAYCKLLVSKTIRIQMNANVNVTLTLAYAHKIWAHETLISAMN